MVHADGLSALKLTHIDAHDAAPDRFGHVGTRIDGNNNDTDRPDILEGNAEEIRQSVIDKHRLQDHRRSPEYLHIDPDDDPDQLQQDTFQDVIIGIIRDRLKDPAEKTDNTSYHRSRHSQYQCVGDTGQIDGTVFRPQTANVR